MVVFDVCMKEGCHLPIPPAHPIVPVALIRLIPALLFLRQCAPLLIRQEVSGVGDDHWLLHRGLLHYCDPLILNGREAQVLAIPLALVALIGPTLEIAISGGLTGAVGIPARVIEAVMFGGVFIGGRRGRIGDNAHGDNDCLDGDGWPRRGPSRSNILVRAIHVHLVRRSSFVVDGGLFARQQVKPNFNFFKAQTTACGWSWI